MQLVGLLSSHLLTKSGKYPYGVRRGCYQLGFDSARSLRRVDCPISTGINHQVRGHSKWSEFQTRSEWKMVLVLSNSGR